jgi:uncharacterized protein YbbC (DUF1343 family)
MTPSLLTWFAFTSAAGAPAVLPSVSLGVDVLLSDEIHLIENKRVGLVTNASGADRQLIGTRVRLAKDGRFELKQLYSPEHGLDGAAPAGKGLRDGADSLTGLPVQSLFGSNTAPTMESLKGIDVLLFDIQGLGSRTYTYASTMGASMVRAKEAGIPFVVLDRPNPLGGLLFEGPVLEEKRFGFLGWGPTPVTHGLTMGELATFFNKYKKIGADLHVVKMKGWKRAMLWSDTGLIWVPTSPAIPHKLQAYLYVATGMVGGVSRNVNEGYGTTSPFERIGAEFINAHAFTQALREAKLPGVVVKPVFYKPSYGRFRDKNLAGTQLFLTNPRAFQPLRTALTILTTLEKLYPGKTRFKSKRFVNAIWGDATVIPSVRAGKTAAEIMAGWKDELMEFAKRRAAVLLY